LVFLVKLSFIYLSFKNAKGEEGLVIPFFLPAHVMERLVKELHSVLMCMPAKGDPKYGVINSSL